MPKCINTEKGKLEHAKKGKGSIHTIKTKKKLEHMLPMKTQKV